MQVINNLTKAAPTGNTYIEVARAIGTLLNSGVLTNLAPALPFLLRMKGRPFTLEKHFPMEPMFATQPADETVLKCGRQVGKSTTLGAQGIIWAAMIPFFNSLYVSPRFEQTRRFSSSVVKPLLAQSPLASVTLDKNSDQSVLQKSFTNGATQYFSFAFLDCERIRGLSCDAVRYDECISLHTNILCIDGEKTVGNLRPGDIVIAFDNDGQLMYDTVKQIMRRGRRHVWKLELANGTNIVCTDNERVLTTAGWMYLADCIAQKIEDAKSGNEAIQIDSYSRSGEAGITGHSAGRWVDVLDRREPREVRNDTRCSTGGILSPQGRGFTQLCQLPAEHSSEQGLGKTKLRFCYSNIAGIRVFTHPMLPNRSNRATEEIRDKGVVRRARSGSLGLLVHGRRHSGKQEPYCTEYPCLLGGGDRQAYSPISTVWHPFEERTCQKEWQDVLHNQPRQGKLGEVFTPDPAFRSSEHGVQVRPNCLSAADNEMQQLPPRNTGTPSGRKQLLSGSKVPAGYAPEGEPQIHREEPTEGSCAAEIALSLQPGGVPPEVQGAGAETTSGSDHPRTDEGPPAGAEGANERRPGIPGEAEGGAAALLPAAESRPDEAAIPQDEGECQATFGDLIASNIVSLEYLGEEEVYDIETENFHTFFANGIAVHNCQDIDPDFLPIIDETLAASDYNRRQYSGTPKHNDNILQVKWEASSQGEWVIKCPGCGHWNICGLSGDLVQMIQKNGPSCSKCGHLVDPATGHFEHAFAERRTTFAGYHIPQIILPRHYAPNPLTGSMKRWHDLVYAKEHKSKQYFYNEKLGESCDERVGLVTLEDLKRASTLPWTNAYREGLRHTKRYISIVLGVDWGGGGESDISYTTISIVGFRHDNTAELIYGERLSNVIDYADETKIILQYFRDFNCNILAHDNAGSGSARETLLLQAGFPSNKIFPAWYTHKSSTSPMVTAHPPADDRPRWYYSVDKARSLVLLCQLVKSGYIKFPRFNSWSELAEDFCALVEDKRATKGGADIYVITRKATHGDDFAHSTNFACLAQWHSQQRYPNLAESLNVK